MKEIIRFVSRELWEQTKQEKMLQLWKVYLQNENKRIEEFKVKKQANICAVSDEKD